MGIIEPWVVMAPQKVVYEVNGVNPVTVRDISLPSSNMPTAGIL
jgi:hypothetical protein